MNPILEDIREKLFNLIQHLESVIESDAPLGSLYRSLPWITKSELIDDVQSIINMIESAEVSTLGDSEAQIADYSNRLEGLYQSIIHIYDTPGAFSAYIFTLDGLRKTLASVLSLDDKAAVTRLKAFNNRLKGMETSLDNFKPRITSLASMIENIEQAHNAADQLPTDLATLLEARNEIADLRINAREDQSDISRIQKAVSELDIELKKIADNAETVLKRCETAYSAATSVGLAAAFSERAKTLSISMRWWSAGLFVALLAGGILGWQRLYVLSELFKVPDPPFSMIALNLVLSVLSVGAPVWFAWLSTKQIGQRFKLAEDYAFKASIARAYEGFRREAEQFGEGMEAKLLASALDRFDELPLRLVETTTYGSPWQELTSSDAVKRAVRIPGFVDKVKAIAGQLITPTKDRPTEAKPTVTHEDEQEVRP